MKKEKGVFKSKKKKEKQQSIENKVVDVDVVDKEN